MKQLIAIISMFLIVLTIQAQDVIPTKGKEFWMGFMRNYLNDSDQSLDLFITSDVSTNGVVEMPALGWSEAFVLTANNTTTVTVPSNLAESFASEIIADQGVHILTDDTVSVFAVNFKPISSDGSKILPVESLGTDYIISAYTGHQNYGSQFMIIATEDDTEIEITPTALTYGGQMPGVPFVINLDQGQSYQVFADLDDNGDFMGTRIRSTANSGSCRPFAVFSGASCADVPDTCPFCDHIYDQNFSINTWGKEFYVPPIALTPGGYTYRVMASQDGTNVNINNTSNYILNTGEYLEFNDEIISQCINADKPISVTQYFQGGTCAGNGDPAMLILNDANQKIDIVTFSTMESEIITNHGLNIITETSNINNVILDGGVINPGNFIAFPPCPDFSYAHIDIPEGTHTLESDEGFTAYVFGVGSDESYAYSVGSFFVEADVLELVDSVICTDSQVVLDANPVLTDVIWYLDEDEDNVIQNGSQLVLDTPFDSGVYVSFGTDQLSGCEEEELYLIEFNQAPVITANDSEICKYESVQLDFNVDPINDNYEVQWTPAYGLDDPNILSPIASPLETTEYSVEFISEGGCGIVINETIEVEVLSGSISGLDLEADQSNICEGTAVNLVGSVEEIVFEDNFDPGVSWGLWCDISNGTGSIACGSVSGSALYFNGFGNRFATTESLDVSNGGNIVFSLKVASGVAPCDDTEFGEDIVLEYSTNGCGGPFINMDTYFEFEYPNFTEVVVEIPAGASTNDTHFRWRQVSNSGINQDNWSLDDVYIGIEDNDAYEFLWGPDDIFDVSNGITNTALPTEDVMINLEVIDNISGCVYRDSVGVQVFPMPDFDLPEDIILCASEEISIAPTMNAAGDYDFVWNSNDGIILDEENEELVVTPLNTTTYDVLVTDENSSCTGSKEIIVTLSELESVMILASSDGICQGEEVEFALEVNPEADNISIEWDSSELIEETNPLLISSVPMFDLEVGVIVTDLTSNCTLESADTVIVSQPFTVVSSADVEACNVLGTVMNVEAFDVDEASLTWSWNHPTTLDQSDSNSVTVIENTSNLYIVTATNEFNCSAEDTTQITLAFENFDLGPNIDLCEGETQILQTGFDFTHDFIWNGDPSISDPYISIDSPGIYHVFIESEIGCTFEDELEVVYYPNPVVDLGPDIGVCEGEDVILDAQNVGMQYTWSDDQETQSISVNEAGFYWVEIKDANNCLDVDSIYLSVFEYPNVNLPDSLFACDGQDLILDAGIDGELYEWNSGEESSLIIIEETGYYEVAVTNEYGCETVDGTHADFGAKPTVILPPDVHFCEGDSIIVEPLEMTEGDFFWSTGDTAEQLVIDETVFLTITLVNDFCEDIDAMSISVHPIPSSSLPDTIVACPEGDGVGVTAFIPEATYEWSNGETTPYAFLQYDGFHYVDITGPYGCQGRDSILLEAFCPDTALYIPNSFTPNGDGKNDEFSCVGRNITDFSIQIYNRWDQLVFESNDINKAWDGSHLDGHEYYVIKDTYVYAVQYKYVRDRFGTKSDFYRKEGYITLVR